MTHSNNRRIGFTRSVDYHALKASIDAFSYNLSGANDDGEPVNKKKLKEIYAALIELCDLVDTTIEFGVEDPEQTQEEDQ